MFPRLSRSFVTLGRNPWKSLEPSAGLEPATPSLPSTRAVLPTTACRAGCPANGAFRRSGQVSLLRVVAPRRFLPASMSRSNNNARLACRSVASSRGGPGPPGERAIVRTDRRSARAAAWRANAHVIGFQVLGRLHGGARRQPHQRVTRVVHGAPPEYRSPPVWGASRRGRRSVLPDSCRTSR
jgi:hypothetical protein